MTTGQTAGEIEKAPATATAAPAKDAASAATDKTQTAAADATAKPNGADPAAPAGDRAADPAVVKTPAASLLDDADVDDDEGDGEVSTAETDKAKPAGDFPDDWREKMSGGNAKILEAMKRYKSPHDWAKAGFAAQQKIRSGEYKAKLADDATPEQKAEWRKDNNIPEEAKAYEIPKVPGHQWTDADVPMLDGFKGVAHEADMTQAQVNRTVSYYAKMLSDAKEAHEIHLLDKDKSDKTATEDGLRAKLGGEYRASVQLFSRLLKDSEVFPDGMADKLAEARFADGTRVINDPAMADFFIGYARERYGDAAFISGDAKQAMVGEEEKIREIMKTDSDKYFREGWDKKLTDILNRKAGKGRAA